MKGYSTINAMITVKETAIREFSKKLRRGFCTLITIDVMNVFNRVPWVEIMMMWKVMRVPNDTLRLNGS